MNLKSIRWKLPLTYAGIALITALVLGGTLVAILRDYYQQQELNYLRKNATAIGSAVGPLLVKDAIGSYPINDLKSHLSLLAFLSQARVRLLDPQGNEIVNISLIGAQDPKTFLSAVSLPAPSGTAGDIFYSQKFTGALPSETDLPPGILGIRIYQTGQASAQASGSGNSSNIEARAVPEEPSAPASDSGNSPQIKIRVVPEAASASQPGSMQKTKTLISVIPAVGTMYGFDLQGDAAARMPRSSQVYRQAILASDGTLLGSVELSGGPSVGWDIIMGVVRGWILASLVGVFIAILAGWWFSRRLTDPLLALTDTTLRMADGDLSVRVHPIQARRPDEFGSLGRAFNKMADRIEVMVKTLQCFASDAAHELRTPLTALHTNLELLTADLNLVGNSYPVMEQTWSQMQRLEKLTTGLLDLSRLETGANETSMEAVEMKGLVEEICEIYASSAEQKDITFQLDLPSEEVWLNGNKGQLCQALGNLLDNALKFTGAGGKIYAGLSNDQESIRIWIEDSGIGIPEEDLPYVFSRFHRGRNALSYPGSGLGLAIVKAIVGQHGGQIELNSSAGGTRFVIQLPNSSTRA